MKSPVNKAMNVNDETGKAEEHDFMFPHSPNPITIKAKDIHEATEKFNKIISQEKK